MSSSQRSTATDSGASEFYKGHEYFANGIISYIDKKLAQYKSRWGENISTTGDDLGWDYGVQTGSLPNKEEKAARVPTASERRQIKKWLEMTNDADKKIDVHNLLLIILKVKGFNTTVDGKSITTGIDNMVKLKQSLECLTGDCRNGIKQALKLFCNTTIPQGKTMYAKIEKNATDRSKLDANDSSLTKWVEECCKLISEGFNSTKDCQKAVNARIGKIPNKKKCSGKGKGNAPDVIHVNEESGASEPDKAQLKAEEAYIKTLLTDYTNVSPIWRNYVLLQAGVGNFVKFRETKWNAEAISKYGDMKSKGFKEFLNDQIKILQKKAVGEIEGIYKVKCATCWICSKPIYLYYLHLKNKDEENQILPINKCGQDEHVLPPGVGNFFGTITADKDISSNMGSYRRLQRGGLFSHGKCNVVKSGMIWVLPPTINLGLYRPSSNTIDKSVKTLIESVRNKKHVPIDLDPFFSNDDNVGEFPDEAAIKGNIYGYLTATDGFPIGNQKEIDAYMKKYQNAKKINGVIGALNGEITKNERQFQKELKERNAIYNAQVLFVMYILIKGWMPSNTNYSQPTLTAKGNTKKKKGGGPGDGGGGAAESDDDAASGAGAAAESSGDPTLINQNTEQIATKAPETVALATATEAAAEPEAKRQRVEEAGADDINDIDWQDNYSEDEDEKIFPITMKTEDIELEILNISCDGEAGDDPSDAGGGGGGGASSAGEAGDGGASSADEAGGGVESTDGSGDESITSSLDMDYSESVSVASDSGASDSDAPVNSLCLLGPMGIQLDDNDIQLDDNDLKEIKNLFESELTDDFDDNFEKPQQNMGSDSDGSGAGGGGSMDSSDDDTVLGSSDEDAGAAAAAESMDSSDEEAAAAPAPTLPESSAAAAAAAESMDSSNEEAAAAPAAGSPPSSQNSTDDMFDGVFDGGKRSKRRTQKRKQKTRRKKNKKRRSRKKNTRKKRKTIRKRKNKRKTNKRKSNKSRK